jgi:hypothetical protein
MAMCEPGPVRDALRYLATPELLALRAALDTIDAPDPPAP